MDDSMALAPIIGEDRFSGLPPEPQTLKFYIPLTVDLYVRNSWGALED